MSRPVRDLITLGEPLVALIAEQTGPLAEAATFRRHVVGAELNVAIGLCRLGRSAAFIGRVGDDGLGLAVRRRLRGEGVDTTWLRCDPAAATGVLLRERQEAVAPQVMYLRHGSAGSRLCPEDVDPAAVAASRRLHVSGITAAISASARAAVEAAIDAADAAGVPVSFDPNHRRRLWSDAEAAPILVRLAARADLVLPGEDELELMTGCSDPLAGAQVLLRGGTTRLVVVKLGARGALAVERGGQLHVPGATLPRVVDAVGAGDAFAAGLLAGFAAGAALPEALAQANRCGAAATTAWGDTEGFPTGPATPATDPRQDVIR